MASCLRKKRFSAASARRDRETSTRRWTRSRATEDNVLRLCVSGWKTAPSMNDQLYTLLDVTRLPIGGWTRFLRTTGTFDSSGRDGNAAASTAWGPFRNA